MLWLCMHKTWACCVPSKSTWVRTHKRHVGLQRNRLKVDCSTANSSRDPQPQARPADVISSEKGLRAVTWWAARMNTHLSNAERQGHLQLQVFLHRVVSHGAAGVLLENPHCDRCTNTQRVWRGGSYLEKDDLTARWPHKRRHHYSLQICRVHDNVKCCIILQPTAMIICS